MQLTDSLAIAASGMRAQGDRLRVVAENLANADSTATAPGQDPYRRKLITFKNVLDQETGANIVQVDKRTYDSSEFNRKYMPGHPAADAEGYILTPNVSSITELMDMREARRAYEANLNVVEMARSMINKTIDLLR